MKKALAGAAVIGAVAFHAGFVYGFVMRKAVHRINGIEEVTLETDKGDLL